MSMMHEHIQAFCSGFNSAAEGVSRPEVIPGGMGNYADFFTKVFAGQVSDEVSVQVDAGVSTIKIAVDDHYIAMSAYRTSDMPVVFGISDGHVPLLDHRGEPQFVNSLSGLGRLARQKLDQMIKSKGKDILPNAPLQATCDNFS